MGRTLKYNGIGYNADWVARKPQDEFVEHRLKCGDFKKFPDEERRGMLKSIHGKCCTLCGIRPKLEAPAPTPVKTSKKSTKKGN